MFRRLRSALRDRVVRAVQEGTSADQLRVELAALGRRLADVESRLGDVRGDLAGWERRQRRDVLTAADWEASMSSADFFRAELSAATPYFAKEHTLRAALEAVSQEGLHLEFGVASGDTLRVIAEVAPAGSVFGFDSFQGLPEHWRPGYTAGTFAVEQVPDVPGAELVVGLFDRTLPGFLERHPEPVAFLHLDADLYSSTRTVLELLAPRLVEGTVLVFDEYLNFPGWQQHEHRAWTEFVAETGLRFEYLGFTADDEQLSLRITGAPVLEAAGHAPPS